MGKGGWAPPRRAGVLPLLLMMWSGAVGSPVQDPFPQPPDEPIRPLRYSTDLGWLAQCLGYKTGAEVGYHSSRNAGLTDSLLKEWQGAEKLYKVEGKGEPSQDTNHQGADSKVIPTDQDTLLRGDLKETKLEFIFLHLPESSSEKSVHHQLANWWERLVDGGVLAGPYYDDKKSGRQVVMDFFQDLGVQAGVTYMDQENGRLPSFYVRRPEGGKTEMQVSGEPAASSKYIHPRRGKPLKQTIHGPVLPLRYRTELPDLCEQLKLKRGLEIGVKGGQFSSEMLSDWPSAEAYYCVDPWEQQKNYLDIANLDQSGQDDQLRQAKKRLEPWKDKVHIIRNYSSNVVDQFKDGSLDFIYIDARHDYKGAMEDLVNYWPKLRKGGIMAGHDFLDAYELHHSPYGGSNMDWSISADGSSNGKKAVRQAVVEFAGKVGKQLQVTFNTNVFPSFVMKK